MGKIPFKGDLAKTTAEGMLNYQGMFRSYFVIYKHVAVQSYLKGRMLKEPSLIPRTYIYPPASEASGGVY